MGSPRPTGPVDPLYAGCYFPAPFVQNDGSDFNHTGTVFGVYSADFVELSWKKQIQVDLFGKPRKLFFANFSWQDGDVPKEVSGVGFDRAPRLEYIHTFPRRPG
jgi:hypothetical protein